MMSVGLHCRIADGPRGRARLPGSCNTLAVIRAWWFARRDEIAKWWLEHYPPGTLQ